MTSAYSSSRKPYHSLLYLSMKYTAHFFSAVIQNLPFWFVRLSVVYVFYPYKATLHAKLFISTYLIFMTTDLAMKRFLFSSNAYFFVLS